MLVFDLAPKQFNMKRKLFSTSGAGVIIWKEKADLISYTKCNLGSVQIKSSVRTGVFLSFHSHHTHGYLPRDSEQCPTCN